MSYNNRRLMSLDEFRLEVAKHLFSYQITHGAEALDEDRLERFVRAQDYEANVLFPTAWAGGDEYMQILASASQKYKERLLAPSRVEALTNKFLDDLDPEFREYLRMLASHDWHYGYSDDIKVWSHSNEVQLKLNAFKARGGMWEKAYNQAVPK